MFQMKLRHAPVFQRPRKKAACRVQFLQTNAYWGANFYECIDEWDQESVRYFFLALWSIFFAWRASKAHEGIFCLPTATLGGSDPVPLKKELTKKSCAGGSGASNMSFFLRLEWRCLGADPSWCFRLCKASTAQAGFLLGAGCQRMGKGYWNKPFLSLPCCYIRPFPRHCKNTQIFW